MFAHDCIDALLARGEDVEPQKHRPEPVFFPHMIRAGAGALLAADRDEPGVQQIAEEFPARRRFIKRQSKSLRNAVGGAAGGHGARDAGDSALVARRKMRIGGEDGEAVGGRRRSASGR